MKKFEEELFGKIPCKFGLNTEAEYKQSILVKHFGDWVSPEDHQAEIEKTKLENFRYREEIARMQKSLHKKNKAIKELNGAVKKTKSRLKECEDLRIEANNEAAKEYSLKCEVVKERTELKRENQRLRAENIAVKTLVENAKKENTKKQQPEVPEFVAEFIEKYKGRWSLFGAFKNISSDRVNNETLYNWVFAHAGRQEKFGCAWINGYTVAKEKRFYLKNKLTGDFLVKWGDYLSEVKVFRLQEEPEEGQFTQQEIDSMETGSYEQIEVQE